MHSYEVNISLERRAFDEWLDSFFQPGEPRNLNGELEASYHNWAKIGAVFTEWLSSESISNISPTAKADFFYLFSRSDELNLVVNWIRPTNKKLSHIIDLSESKFFELCEMSLSLPEDTSDWQLTACFEKFESPSPIKFEYLDRFFERNESYTKRRALHAMVHLKRNSIESYVNQLWKNKCEFAKLSCLHALYVSGENNDLFNNLVNEYQSLFPIHKADYRAYHMKTLNIDC